MKTQTLMLAIGLLTLAACGESQVKKYDETVNSAATAPVGGKIEALKIVGSSTVSPFATTVAEQFGASSSFPTPIVETTGTGGGFKAFCQGLGPDQPTITNASRPVKDSEVALCADAGITDLVEVKIGYDGIIIGNAMAGPALDLTKGQIYQALAADLPDGNGGFMPNPNKTWADIDPSLPATDIQVFGPPPTSGTRDAFVEIAMEGGAKSFPAMAALKSEDGNAFKTRAHTLRSDGAWIDAGENDTQIIQTLTKNPNVMGVFGFSFLDQNGDRVKGMSVGGVQPTFENISAGDYGVSRSMYLYVKKQNAPMVQGLEEYLAEFTNDAAWGPDGYLADKGLIPLPEAERAAMRDAALAMKAMD